MDQLYRHDLILRMLPRKENAIDTKTVVARLANQGVEKSTRSIQRDLKELEAKYPHVHSRGEGNAKFWWADKSLSRLSMLPSDAMNLVMIMDHAARFGMATQVDKLQPLHDYARSLLSGNRVIQDCTGKVMSSTRFVTLLPGTILPEVLEVIQNALLAGACVDVLYLKRGATEPRSMHLKPLGLSYQDSNIYLSCVFKGMKPGSIAALPMHRFLAAKETFENIPAPENYDIKSVAAQRSLIGLRSDTPVQLQLRVSHTLYQRLQENPLSHDQQLSPCADGWWQVTASLHLSQGLDLWLLSQGEHLEVLAPEALREQIADTTKRMAALYAVTHAVRHSLS